jgi:putative selenium metabolism protein SsnA
VTHPLVPGSEPSPGAATRSLALVGGTIVRSYDGPVEDSDLVVAGSRIGGDASDAIKMDVSGCVVLPGACCGHHHLYSALARGMPAPLSPPQSFIEILERVWWRLDRALDIETIHLSAVVAAVEAARCGTTSIFDHHSSPQAIDSSLDAVADGVDAAGIRGIMCYEVTDRNGEAHARDGINENLRFLRANRRPGVRGVIGAHASFTLGPATLQSVAGEARAAGAPLHIHVAEGAIDEKDALQKYGVRTAVRLAQADALGEGDLIAHGVHLDDEELSLLRASGAWSAHNPRSNANNRVGRANAAAMGERVCLGTDGIDGDMFAEARFCYLEARRDSSSTGPAFALQRLGAGANLAGGLFGEPALGTLVPGAPADLVVLDYDSPTPLETSNLAGHALFGLSARHVRDVMVAGRWIVRDRRHQLVDEDELQARARSAAPLLWERMQKL